MTSFGRVTNLITQLTYNSIMVLMLRTPILIAKIEMICLSAKMSHVVTVCVGSLIQMQIPIIVVVVFLTIQIVAFILVVGILLIELGCYLHISH